MDTYRVRVRLSQWREYDILADSEEEAEEIAVERVKAEGVSVVNAWSRRKV